MGTNGQSAQAQSTLGWRRPGLGALPGGPDQSLQLLRSRGPMERSAYGRPYVNPTLLGGAGAVGGGTKRGTNGGGPGGGAKTPGGAGGGATAAAKAGAPAVEAPTVCGGVLGSKNLRRLTRG